MADSADSSRDSGQESPSTRPVFLAPPAHRPVALLIGGEAQSRLLVERALAEDFDVEIVSDVTAELDGRAERRADVIVLDETSIPGAGRETVAAIRGRQELVDVPILLISGAAHDAQSLRLLRAGAQDRLPAPVSAEELRARALNLATMKRARDTLKEAVTSPSGDLESLARQATGEKQSVEAAYRKADAASRAKDEFLAVLAHELRTPLHAVLGWTDLLRREGVSASDVARGLEVIERNARAQARLIEEVLDMSAMMRRKVQIKLDPIALGTVLLQALDAVRPAADARGITIEWEGDAADLTVLGDPERLLQVIHNLVGNAVKFTPDGGRVRVRVSATEGTVALHVEDTGIGIAPDFLPRIFDEFTQARNPLTERPRGLGLGLAIARRLVELHGGVIEAASPGEGRGATFTVRLPLLPSSQPAPAERAR